MTFCCISLSCVFLEMISSVWQWEILVFFHCLEQHLYSTMVSEGRYLRSPDLNVTVHASSSNCFVGGQMENETPICILCPVFSLMGRFRYFSYLKDIKTQVRLALGQSSIFVLMGECAFCNCAYYQEISKGTTDTLPLEEQQCLIKPAVCQITAAPLGLFCANPIWQHNFVPAHPFALHGGLMWCFTFSP